MAAADMEWANRASLLSLESSATTVQESPSLSKASSTASMCFEGVSGEEVSRSVPVSMSGSSAVDMFAGDEVPSSGLVPGSDVL